MSTANCTVTFYEDSNCKGDQRTFSGPTSVSDLSKDHYDGTSGTFNEMDDSVNSLKTGSQGWVTLYSDDDFEGSSVSYGPNTTVNDLGAMKNNMASFKLFDAAPVNITTVINNFVALYPGSVKIAESGTYALNYYQQDASYTVYYPVISQDPGTGNVSFSVDLEHHNTLGERDRATATFTMTNKGTFLNSIAINYDMGNGAYQVPNWMIKIADGVIDMAEDEAIEFADGAEIVLTEGAGVELVIPTDMVINAVADLLTGAVDHINAVITKLFGLTDNGGTMYFASSIYHAVARLAYAYYQERGAANGPLLSFDQSAFQRAMSSSWDDEHKSNPCLKYSYSGSQYRCFYPDNTAFYNKMGMISTVKIDAMNDNDQDDHLILVTTLDPKGNLLSVQGSIDICGAPDDSDDDSKYVAPASGTLFYSNGVIKRMTSSGSPETVPSQYNSLTSAYTYYMQQALDNVAYVDHSDFSSALKNIVQASVVVVNAIDTAVNG